MHWNRYTDDNIEHEHYKNATQKTKTLSFSKELTSWVKLQVEIFCKASIKLQVEIFCKARLKLQVEMLCKASLKLQVEMFWLGHIWLADGCDVLFKTLVKITWKWVIYYTADALKSLYRRQYRTRTLKKR
jgi:hypothetical protein